MMRLSKIKRLASFVVGLVLFCGGVSAQKYSNGKVPTGDKSRIGSDVLRKGTKPNQILMTLGDSTVKYVDADTAAVIARTYKVYTALLTQSGTSAPTATVLENTLGGVPVWTRSVEGVYRCRLIGAFTDVKTIVFTNMTNTSGNVVSLKQYVVAPDDVFIYSEPLQDLDTEDGYISLEIRVYN